MKIFFGFIVVLTLIFGGYLVMNIAGPEQKAGSVVPQADNVRVEDGVQIVDLRAKVGFSPRVSTVKAGIPTTLRVSTSGTFDCSSALRIPSLDISKNLPPTGETHIALGELKPGTLDGTCSMGMYPFQLNVVN